MGGGWFVGDTDKQPGNLMLAIQARSFNSYFYLQSSNTNHPARFVQNKVTGILYENKVEYASTYPIPLLPTALLTTSKSTAFVLTTG